MLTGAVFTSPSVVDVAPMKTILPFTFLAGIVPLITSAAEITFDVPDRSGEKLRSIDFASSVGTKRSPICTPFGRTMNWLERNTAVRHHRCERERGHERSVVGLGDDEGHAAADSVARVLVEVHLTDGRTPVVSAITGAIGLSSVLV